MLMAAFYSSPAVNVRREPAWDGIDFSVWRDLHALAALRL
jgi:hypothetical protein